MASTKGLLHKFPPEKYPALTGIRAIAAYMVFIHHYAAAPDVSGPFSGIFTECHVGVTLFYVLSGFLITYNYSEKADLGKVFWWQYVSRRVGKIYPLYLFILAVTYLLQVASHQPPPTLMSAFLNITLWKGFFDDFKFDGIGPSWSLTVEETFYLLAPFLFVAVRKIGYVTLQVALYLTAGLLLLFGSHLAFNGLFGNFRFVALYTFFGRSFEFIVGMALARMLLKRPELLATSGGLNLTYLGLFGGFLAVFWMSLLRAGVGYGLFHPIGMALNNLVLPISICIMYLGLMSEQTWLRRVLSSGTFVFLGRASYAFYLLHYSSIVLVFIPKMASLDRRLQVCLLFVAVNALSAVLFLLIEHPANSWIRRWASRLVNRQLSVQSPLRVRRGAILWTGTFATVFAIWSINRFGLSGIGALLGLRTGTPSQVQIGIRQFAHPVSAHVGFDMITSDADKLPGLAFRVGGESIAKEPFIFAHAQSKLEYDLPKGRWSVLEFSTGLDDVGGADVGSVEYVVRGDGAVLFSSPVVRALEPATRHSVSVKGVRRLELLVTDGGNGVTNDEAYWIDPILR